MNEKIAQIYSNFAEQCTFEDVPQEVVSRTKELFLDFIGVTLAGYKDKHLARLAHRYADELGGHQQCTMLGTNRRYPGPTACFSNGVLSHAIDLDDGHKYAEMHPSVVIVPPVLAAAELRGSDGKEILTSMIIGYEIALRVGRAVNPDHLNRGFHSSSTCAPFGAAAATAKLFGLSVGEICNAISLAGLQGAGLQEMLHEGQASKPFQVGKAAQSGYLSAFFAEQGLTGPSTIFEGELGWLKAVTDEVNWDILSKDLGCWWDTLNIYTKPYPTCRHVHPGIDIALSLDVDCRSVDKIDYYTYSVALMETGNIFQPENEAAAKFSLPYGIAVALCKKEAGIEAFSDKYLHDESVAELIGKINLFENKEYSGKYPDEKPGKMIISLQGGEVIEREMILPIGEPEVPIDKEGLENKFFDCTSAIISHDATKKLIHIIDNLEEVVSLGEVLSLCVVHHKEG